MTHDFSTPSATMATRPSLWLSSSSRRNGILVGLGLVLFGIVATAVEWTYHPGQLEHLLTAYLVSFWFLLSLALGALFFVLIQHVTGSVWSVSIRRIAENMAGTLPLFAILFIPIALGARNVYHEWATPGAHTDEVIAAKASYLNLPFFWARAALYLTLWGILGYWVRHRSVLMDQEGPLPHMKSLRKWSGPALLVAGTSLAFAGFDWIMSLDPHWATTMFGVYLFAGGFVTALGVLTLISFVLRRQGLLHGVITQEHDHDLGKLLFAFSVFWAYIWYSQYFLTAYADIPEETYFFGIRLYALDTEDKFQVAHLSGWGILFWTFVVGHFVIPLWVLLSRAAKRSHWALGIAAVSILIAHYMDLYWWIGPIVHPKGFSLDWFHITTLIGLVGLVGTCFVFLLGRSSLVPVRDPFLRESVEFENV